MGETLSNTQFELSDDEVEAKIKELEGQFTVPVEDVAKSSLQKTTFGEQLMEEADFATIPLATGGPTWTRTGSIQDATDGDKGGQQKYF